MTKTYGILAHPAWHSLSPAMFNAAFETMAIDAKYEVFDEPVLNTVRGLSADLAGLSVSLPYKESVIEFLDEMSEDVRMIGACNTVKILEAGGEKTVSGFNTDWSGFLEALKEKVASVKDLNVIVLGAGGAARAIVYGLVKEGAKVVILNRTVEKAAKIAEDFANIGASGQPTEIQFGSLDEIENFKCDVLVQATSAWINDKEVHVNFVSEEFLQNNEPIVFDIVYRPLITPLLQIAIDNGCEVITGEKMLLNQAVKQFEIWFEQEAPREVMRKILENSLY